MAAGSLSQEVGRVLRARRLAAGLSQEELADMAGLDRTYIGRLEAGKQSPTVDTLAKLARTLGVSCSEILLAAEMRSTAPPASDPVGPTET